MSIFSPHPNPTLRVLSLGLGVQSTTLLHMAAAGEFEAVPDIAFFADTQSEPRAVYDHLARLKGLNTLPFELRVITRGNLGNDIAASRNTTGQRFAAVPFFVRDPEGAIGKGRRQCTKEYKLEPIWAAIRKELGVLPGKRVPKGVIVETWIGITTDEVMRASASRHRWEHKRHPLIERSMSRGDCIEWLKRNGHDVPVKSRCIFCPFTANEEWRRIKVDDLEQWTEAVEMDALIRAGGKSRGMRGEQFVHRSCVPLAEADLKAPDPRQLLMGDHCDGMCGV